MNDPNFQRKMRIAWLSMKISKIRSLMNREAGVTDKWKHLARKQTLLIQQRNELMTADEIRDLEKRRGLA